MTANDQQVLGYRVAGPDNGSFMYEGELDPPVCPECWLVTEPEWVSPTFSLRRRRFDLSYTYDGALIASDRFLDVTSGFAGLRSTPLPSAPGFHLLVATREVEFDSAKRSTAFEGLCPMCGRYTAVAPNARLDHTLAYSQSAEEFAARDDDAPHHLVRIEFENRGFRSWVKFSQFGDLPEAEALRARAGMESYFDSLAAYLTT